MPQFDLPNGVQLDITEGHSVADRLSGYDSGAVLWAASPPLARWLATEPEPKPKPKPEPEPEPEPEPGPEPGPELELSEAAVELGCGAGLVSLALAASSPTVTSRARLPDKPRTAVDRLGVAKKCPSVSSWIVIRVRERVTLGLL